MKMLLSGVVVTAIIALALPAWAQGVTPQGQPTQQNAPGTAGTSKPGVPGLPGSKSGPTVTPSGTTAPEATRSHPSGDQSGVQGPPRLGPSSVRIDCTGAAALATYGGRSVFAWEHGRPLAKIGNVDRR